MSSAPSSTLTKSSREFIELLAFIYLQHHRAADAAVLLELLSFLSDDIRLQGAVALAQLRADQPDKALRAIESVPLRSQLGGPLKPAFQLLRAQSLYALDHHPEAAAAMQAFIAARRQAQPSHPSTATQAVSMTPSVTAYVPATASSPASGSVSTSPATARAFDGHAS